MAVTRMLASIADLATLMKVTIVGDDAYGLLILQQASNAVRDEARQPNWVRRGEVGDVVTLPDVEAPQTALDITLWVASRAYPDQRNLSRRTAGPISETFFENGVYGLELTQDEKDRLGLLRPVQSRNMPWTAPITQGLSDYDEDVWVPTYPDRGPFRIANGGDFPYNHPEPL